MRSLALALTVLATLGCDRLLGIEDVPRHVDPATETDAGFKFASSACSTCERKTDNCGKQLATCLADPACATLAGCVFGCDPSSPEAAQCRLNCEDLSKAASKATPWLLLDQCTREKDCTEACYGNGSGLIARVESNCACTEADCRAQSVACVKNGDCARRLACLGRDVNPDNYVRCVGEFPGGGTEASALLQCARDKSACDAKCSIAGGITKCAGKFTYGTTGDDTVGFTLGVESAGGEKIGGALVKACSPSCATCTLVAGTATTVGSADAGVADGGDAGPDLRGKAILDLKMTLGMARAFNGCFKVTGPVDTDAGVEAGTPYLTTHVFAGRSIHLNEDLLSTVLLEPGFVEFYAAFLSGEWDKSRGAIIGVVQDCIWGRVLGATVTIEPIPPTPALDGKLLKAYLKGSEIDTSATSTVARAGFAFLNMAPGNYRLKAMKDGVEIVNSTVEVTAGVLTDATLYPKPQ